MFGFARSKIGIFLCLILGVVFLSSCSVINSLIGEAKVRPPEVSFAGGKLSGLSFDAADFLFDLEILNPNGVGLKMSGFDYNRPSQKVILLITDGEDHETDTLAVAQQAADEGIMLYTIGFGSPQGEPIPEYNTQREVVGFKRDQQGEVVLSKLDEATLQQIAQIGHGRYFRASADGSELEALLGALSTLQKAKLASQMETWAVERFQGFLLVALLALLVSEFIPDRLRQKVALKRAAMSGQTALATAAGSQS